MYCSNQVSSYRIINRHLYLWAKASLAVGTKPLLSFLFPVLIPLTIAQLLKLDSRTKKVEQVGLPLSVCAQQISPIDRSTEIHLWKAENNMQISEKTRNPMAVTTDGKSKGIRKQKSLKLGTVDCTRFWEGLG